MADTIASGVQLQVSEWLNTDTPIRLEDLRGRVVVIHAFQMLCPGCVSHGLPQAARIHAAFDANDVVTIGLHTVFEHHAVMTVDALRAFVHEYRLRFPIGVDLAVAGTPIPATMLALGLRGTPSLVVLDRQGRIRMHRFGQVDDLEVGASIGGLAAQPWQDESAGAGLSSTDPLRGGVCHPAPATVDPKRHGT